MSISQLLRCVDHHHVSAADTMSNRARSTRGRPQGRHDLPSRPQPRQQVSQQAQQQQSQQQSERITTGYISVTPQVRTEGQSQSEQGRTEVPVHTVRAPAFTVAPLARTEVPSSSERQNDVEVKSLSDWMEWHEKLGHVGVQAVRDTLRETGISYANIPSPFDCDACSLTKISRSSAFDNTTSSAFDIVVCGIMGPVRERSMDCHLYVATFQDIHTRYVWVVPLEAKEDIRTALSDWLKTIKRSHNCVPKAFRSDNSLELTSKKISDILSSRKITHQVTADESPQNNGFSKRISRTLIDMVRPMLMRNHSEGEMWHYAIQHAAWLRNRTHTTSVNAIPYTLLYGKKPDLSHVKPFGTLALIWPYGYCDLVPGGSQSLAIVVRMGDVSPKAYKCIDPENVWDMQVTKDIIFTPSLVPQPGFWRPKDFATLFDPEDDESAAE